MTRMEDRMKAVLPIKSVPDICLLESGVLLDDNSDRSRCGSI